MATNEHLEAVKPEKRKPHEPERKCILSGDILPRDALIRLALGPDGEVLPDVRAKAPGRGAWIGVDAPTLDAAQADGKLRGALARAFKTGDLKIADGLAEKTAEALQQTVLDRLGIESRGGAIVLGTERIAEAARSGAVALLLHVSDSAEDGRKKLDQAWRVGEGEEGSGKRGLVIPANRAILGNALGRENLVHIAIVDERAAKRVSGALSRWMKFTGPAEPTEPRESGSRGSPGHECEDEGKE